MRTTRALYIWSWVLMGKNFERYVMILSKDNFESRVRPKCFCSLTFGTTDSLKKRDGWFGLFFLHENSSSVACLLKSGLKLIPLT